MKVSIVKLLLPLIALIPVVSPAYTSITGGKTYTEQGVLQNASVEFEDGVITSVSQKPLQNPDTLYVPTNWHVIPGMIDMHIHGAAGSDVMDATPQALSAIALTLAKEGTTSFLATTMSNPSPKIEAAIKAVSVHQNNPEAQSGAEILGLHLEGPFISKEKAGAQPVDSIIPADLELFKQWESAAPDAIKMVTLAPENDPELKLTKYLKSKNIIASIGHTNADYKTTKAAIDAGCSHATHLFNAMPSVHHRDPGPVPALLLDDRATVELIPDLIHSDPSILKLTHRAKGNDKVILVTDAMRGKCMPDGHYSLGGNDIQVCCGTCKLPDGSLAGSTLKLNDGLRNMQTALNDVPFEQVLKMVTENPAKKLKVWDKKGSLTPGKDADIVVLDDTYQVRYTFCKGKHSLIKSRAEVILVEDHADLGRVTADMILDKLRESLQEGRKFVLGLATGGTPIPVYQSIVEQYQKDESVDFSTTITFNLDEYVGLTQDDPQSYHHYMDKNFFGNGMIYTTKTPRGFKKNNIFIPNGAMLRDISPKTKEKRLTDRVERFKKALATKGPIDVQILGIGHNGHIGFAEPGSPVDGDVSVVTLSESTRKANSRYFNDELSEVPTEAITMGLGTILKAKQIIVIATGKDKAAIVKAALEGPVTEDVPASSLQNHKNVTYIIDKEAASLLGS